MWRLKTPKPAEARLARIVSNYEVLLEHDEPVLFTGTTELGVRALASSVDEDPQARIERFLYSLLDDSTYSKFVNRKLSYREVLESAPGLFVADQNGHNEAVFSYIRFDEIPERYKPSPTSYLPKFEVHPLAEYSMSLKGQLADTNAAEPNIVANLQKKGAELLRDAFASLRTLTQPPKILLQTATAGSFNINYKVLFDDIQGNLFQGDLERDFLHFANEYIAYCLNNLPDQVEAWTDLAMSTEVPDHPLINHFLNLHGVREATQDNQLRSSLLKAVRATVRDLADLSEEVGEGYDYIALAHKTENQTMHPLGVVDADYRKQLERIETVFEERFEEGKTETDSEFREYKILVYHLNVDSRIGNALIYNVGSQDELSKPRIRISGDEPLPTTKYTESMHKNRFVTVQGKATRKGNRFKSIDIAFE